MSSRAFGLPIAVGATHNFTLQRIRAKLSCGTRFRGVQSTNHFVDIPEYPTTSYYILNPHSSSGEAVTTSLFELFLFIDLFFQKRFFVSRHQDDDENKRPSPGALLEPWNQFVEDVSYSITDVIVTVVKKKEDYYKHRLDGAKMKAHELCMQEKLACGVMPGQACPMCYNESPRLAAGDRFGNIQVPMHVRHSGARHEARSRQGCSGRGNSARVDIGVLHGELRYHRRRPEIIGQNRSNGAGQNDHAVKDVGASVRGKLQAQRAIQGPGHTCQASRDGSQSCDSAVQRSTSNHRSTRSRNTVAPTQRQATVASTQLQES
ncbi:hypothetical protein PHYSODRAFT_307980 [Phytophthora sojae]|uniref:Uncharacterized protein n=1 Tax=Phytophthora sojae (strain P6497) TaxID=1094619 RepID=G5AHD7_PHYSP|nr:hypothetical protein PHYSODRAFT_307980 [Phytophthora sojae]EGZ05115.1 hypothetical protein PHYSODRAFT_307980 [Phytophthora sojae]|eukprot:XP_009539487.1 hypothetical protein PHYSODRAFT_307980 [Phytophthora sojae]